VKQFSVTVSDHAVVRYLERVMGVDVAGLRREILGEGRDRLVAQLGTCALPVRGGARLVAKDGVVVTIRPKDQPARALRKRNPRVARG
jgi:hypothetical protein